MNEHKNNKYYREIWITIGIVFIIIFLCTVIIYTLSNSNFVFTRQAIITPIDNNQPGVIIPAPSKPRTKAIPDQPLSYNDAMAQYRNVRLQFSNCSGSPSSIVIKSGTPLMLDNRSENEVSITLDNNVYKIGGFGFRIVTVSNPSLPHTIDVACQMGENIRYRTAKVLVQ